MLEWIRGLGAGVAAPVTALWRDLRQQPYVMWLFIGWGWLCVLAMAASAFVTYGDFAKGL